jgi:hypothetical protein
MQIHRHILLVDSNKNQFEVLLKKEVKQNLLKVGMLLIRLTVIHLNQSFFHLPHLPLTSRVDSLNLMKKLRKLCAISTLHLIKLKINGHN